MNNLYAIPLGVPFLPSLVEGLIAETASDPLSLARYLVVVPNRRGCLALQEAFLAATPEGCRILPRIMALADIEEGADLPGYIPPAILPPAIPAWRRLGLMSQLALAFEKQKDEVIHTPAGAVSLAQELLRLVDEVEAMGADLSQLKDVVGADYAAHWQLTLDFLKILTDFWPPILEQAGFMEPVARQRMLLEQVALHWTPLYPVVLAGITDTRPATLRFIEAALRLEKGRVILPGVDLSLLQDSQPLPPTHPQHTLNQLIQQVGMPTLWPACPPYSSQRSLFLCQAMTSLPHEGWRVTPEVAEDVLSCIHGIEVPSVLEEARQIALIMRYELETPGQVIALVTPDKELGRRVQAALGRWEVKANVSSGMPLSQSLVGRFLLLSSLLTQDIGVADLLALLKHPLYAKGRNRWAHLQETRQFEIKELRGLAATQIHTLPFPERDMWQPLLALNDGQAHPFTDYLKAHITVAQTLVGQGEDEKCLLWEQEDGKVASDFWKNLLEQGASFPPLMARDYPAFLRNLMDLHDLLEKDVVRDVEGIGSRLLILGILESRLVQADVVILGGLNEGVWPGMPEVDPWLSRSMRESFGLPPLEQKIGLSGHDFCTAMTAPKVYMTRSLKKDGAPTVPSRWWQRLSALLATGGRTLAASHPWGAWSEKLDQPVERTAFAPPAPCPPLSTRPSRLSVTDVGMLLQDPYSIYAKKVLNLRPLDPLDADLSPLERGNAIHGVLDSFVQSGIDPSLPEAMQKFEALGREAFGSLLADPRAMAFWWPQFQRLRDWFLNQMIIEKDAITQIKTETKGGIEIPTAKGPIILTAKADRIDILATGQARIIDYKTGKPPSKKEVAQGYAPQLPLEGLILKVGGFSELPPMEVETLYYWRLTGVTPAGEVTSFDKVTELLDAAERGVRRLFEAFLGRETPFYAYPDPLRPLPYHAYAHLERVKEWM